MGVTVIGGRVKGLRVYILKGCEIVSLDRVELQNFHRKQQGPICEYSGLTVSVVYLG